jgi:hypothetical protein
MRLAPARSATPPARNSIATATDRRFRKPIAWGAAALAAGIILAIAGSQLLQRPKGPSEIERGAGAPMAVSATRTTENTIAVGWQDVEHAARYAVTISTADGRTIATGETTARHLDLKVTQSAGASPFVVAVEAFDALGTRIAESDPLTVGDQSPQ